MRSLCLFALEYLRSLKCRALNVIDSPLVVLLYHRVADLDLDSQQLAVSSKNFNGQMQYLKDNFPVVSLDDDWSHIDEPSVAISFDDGYADNLLNALPIIDAVGVPATFFITTGNIDSNREFWWDELERVIQTGGLYPAHCTLHDDGQETSWPTVTVTDRYHLFAELQERLRGVGPARRERLLQQLRKWAGVSEDGRLTHRALTSGQLQQLASSRWVTIGAHTVSHTPLSTLGVEAQRTEISSARVQLTEWLGRPVTLFSYPFGGQKDYTDKTVLFIKEFGYERAYVNYPGQLHRWTDPYRLPRHLVRDWPVDVFANHLNRFWTYSV